MAHFTYYVLGMKQVIEFIIRGYKVPSRVSLLLFSDHKHNSSFPVHNAIPPNAPMQ